MSETFKEKILRMAKKSNGQTLRATIAIEAKQKKKNKDKLYEQVVGWLAEDGSEFPADTVSDKSSTSNKTESKKGKHKPGNGRGESLPDAEKEHQEQAPVSDSGVEKEADERISIDLENFTNVPPAGKETASASPDRIESADGLCLCGCGQEITGVWTSNHGTVEEANTRFIQGHGRLLKQRFRKLNNLLRETVKEYQELLDLPGAGLEYAKKNYPRLVDRSIEVVQSIQCEQLTRSFLNDF